MDRRQIAGALAGVCCAAGVTAGLSSLSAAFAAYSPELRLCGIGALMLGLGIYGGLYATASRKADLETLTIWQSGAVVGSVIAPSIDRPRRRVVFGTLHGNAQFDRDTAFEFQGMTLQVRSWGMI
jgi:hypothetical protein